MGSPVLRPEVPEAPLAPGLRDLAVAAERGDLELVRALVARHPELVHAEDAAGWNAAAYAAWNRRKEVYEYLVERGAGTSVFTEAALGPVPALVQRVRTNPMAVNARDGRHRAPPLLWAVRTGNQTGIGFLLDMGADVDLADRSGAAALHAAVGAARLEIARTLVLAGADLGLQDDRGRTPLHLAAGTGQLELCSLLLDEGAMPDARDAEGNTPLHLAAATGDFELCEYLLFFGASAGVRNNRGLTPGEVAEGSGHQEVAALLRAQEG